MAGDPEFRTDLYRGTAPFYDEFRHAYPETLLDDLRTRADDGHGQAARSRVRHRSDHVRPRVALRRGLGRRPRTRDGRVRPCEGTQARRRQRSLDRRSRRGRRARTASFELVAIGNAFHRLQRRVIAESAMHWLVPGGHLAVLWSNSPWDGSQEWQHVMADTVHRWTRLAGAAERIPANVDEHLAAEQHRTVLASAGFTVVGEFEFTTPHEWTVETLTGFMYATSFLSQPALGRERSGVRARPARAPAGGGARRSLPRGDQLQLHAGAEAVRTFSAARARAVRPRFAG